MQDRAETAVPRCLGALALELTPQTLAGRMALPQHEAASLAALVARDLAGFEPEAQALDLAVLAAHFDPIELLRPGWPLHSELAELVAGAPGRRDEGRVIAFGSHEGRLPAALAPDGNHVGGPLRLLPFALSGPAEVVERVSQSLESRLIDTGMAGADTALAAQDGFQAQVEHARYLTIHDLCAMTAMQYDHAGLAALWPLVEAALLAPDTPQWLDAAPEPLALYRDGGVRMALLDIDAWVEAGFAPAGVGADRLPAAYERFATRQRQLAAVLQAHGIELVFEHVALGTDPRQALQAPPAAQ
ncbi:MAG: hypothetical protein ACXIUZ_04940 [Lysobacteraceae bacterium]